MRPRWRKVFADLWGNFARFILVVLSLMIGLFSVGMIASGYFAILDDMENGYQAIHPSDLRIITSDFDKALIERIRRVDGVIEADGEKLVPVRMLTGDGEWKNLVIRVIPEEGQKINQVTLLDGAMPEDGPNRIGHPQGHRFRYRRQGENPAFIGDDACADDHRIGSGPNHWRDGNQLLCRTDIWLYHV